jgi:hypothetical protein
VSRRDGRVAHAFRRSLWIGSARRGPAAMEKQEGRLRAAPADPSPPGTMRVQSERGLGAVIQDGADDSPDVSANMMRRAKCRHVVRYGMDPTSNIKVLLRERESQPRAADASVPGEGDLLHVWSWVERVDELCGEADDPSGGTAGFFWPARSLADAGAARFILLSEPEPDEQVFSETLGCVVHDSPGRQ